MSTRISSALALLLVTGCGRAADNAAAAAPGRDTIECALAGVSTFTRTCAVERVEGAEGLQLVVRDPEGGFRRFDVLRDGHGLAVADGAQPARVTVRDGGIEVAVGADRYRFPAKIADGKH